MRKFWKECLMGMSAVLLLTGCMENPVKENATQENAIQENATVEWDEFEETVKIVLSDEKILVEDKEISEDENSAVYVANDIVFYLENQDFTYGEGAKEDEHSKEEADSHSVVHITKPGTYELSGSIKAGQIAVDLGEDAKENPQAVVTLVMNGVDINCSVAPAVIFYNVYECGNTDETTATKDVDTSGAGANVIIADGTVNNINGAYVAKIYKSVQLNEAKTEVVDSKKLHKYDGAFYSKMSMNVNGDELGTGILNIVAKNEGLDSELHLTINGGNINIDSGNDGINTNEDNISVTTINGGNLNIVVNEAANEGDGIDSNGWLVINGGTVIASGCGTSGDAGIDSDMGISINGGTVLATGNMLDRISESNQNYVVFAFDTKQEGNTTYTLKNADGTVVSECTPQNGFMYLIMSDDELVNGLYSLYGGKARYQGMTQQNIGFGDPGKMPEGMIRPEKGEMPEGMIRPEKGEMPEDMIRPEKGEMPEDMIRPEKGEFSETWKENEMILGEMSTEFEIVEGGNYFERVGVVK